jgi:hypothetical protein
MACSWKQRDNNSYVMSVKRLGTWLVVKCFHMNLYLSENLRENSRFDNVLYTCKLESLGACESCLSTGTADQIRW